MLQIFDSQTARNTILLRQAPDELLVPPSLMKSIHQLFGSPISPAEAVDVIIKDVRRRGDTALKEWSRKIDGLDADTFTVDAKDLNKAINNLDRDILSALELASNRIRDFHKSQPVNSWITQSLGGTLGQLVRPIKRVGLYIPAGSAPLPSSVLMSAIPAQVAGVNEIVLVSPPNRQTGKIDPIVLAAAELLGIKEVYTLGGAQAIAALAYGTATIRKVDKIYGPGNIFVTLAKRQVFGAVGIDNIFGPTETVIIADAHAKPAWVAADLLAQAEHDVMAAAILLTPSNELAQFVQVEIEKQLRDRNRKEIISISFENRSGIILTKDLFEAVELANYYAPEHLCLAVVDPWAWVDKINAAGGVFMGEHSFEVLGDYVAGPSHVMPTSGSARFSSPLNVLDFVHFINLIALDSATTQQIGAAAVTIASSENLDGHANAARIRL